MLMLLALLVALLLPLSAAAAPPEKGDTVCGLLDSTGQDFVLGTGRLVFTHEGQGACHFVCTGQQDFRPDQPVRYDYDSTGQTCGVVINGEARRSTQWNETISRSGQIQLTCTVPAGD
jgi:hypothetical protein